MKMNVRRETAIVLILGCLILLLNAAPWAWRITHVPSGREFIPFHNSAGDYPTYVSFIKEGLDSDISVHNKFTSVPHKGGVIFILYVALGHIGRIFGASDAHLIYHASRYLFGALWLFLLYAFFRRIFKTESERILAFLFVTTSCSFPFWTMAAGKPSVSWYMLWWTEFDPIARAAFLPHYLVGHCLLILTLLFLFPVWERGKRPVPVRAMISGWFAGLIHPPSLIILLLFVPVYGVLTKNIRVIVSWIFLAAASTTSLLYINWQSKQFPWSLGRGYESMSFAISIPELFLTLGPVLILSCTVLFAIRKDRKMLLYVLWAAVSVGMVILSKFLLTLPYGWARLFPLSNIRFLQTAIWVPLSVLAARGMYSVYLRWGKIPVIVVMALYLALTLFGYPDALRRQYESMSMGDDYHVPKTGWIDAMRVAGTQNTSGPVLSLPWAGALIPSYTGKTVYVGNEIATPYYEEHLTGAYRFYQGLPVCDAYALLRKNNISVIFYGFDEQRAGDAVKRYPFLTTLRDFGSTVLYTVASHPPAECGN